MFILKSPILNKGDIQDLWST